MESIYLRTNKRGLEIQKIISLNTQITRAESSQSFSVLLKGALSNSPSVSTGGVMIKTANNDQLVIQLELASLDLNGADGSADKFERFKNISVRLPALPGPYQELEITLGMETVNYVALSRRLDGSGMFRIDFIDSRHLPFQDDASSGKLVLTFFNAGTGQAQRELVESLVDVIFKFDYTL
ncbi:hypothetical protein ACIOZM_30965 [Pseudomonas sp. NPDC087346]|uniref:hypothetical protein n=1 Tax=Pseudomonas sp. NPDC087346 TaxID=3364438 RepID=UPI0037FE532A